MTYSDLWHLIQNLILMQIAGWRGHSTFMHVILSYCHWYAAESSLLLFIGWISESPNPKEFYDFILPEIRHELDAVAADKAKNGLW